MGYFPHRTAFDWYKYIHCRHCLNYKVGEKDVLEGCPVMAVHWRATTGSVSLMEIQSGLDMLIPMKDGENQKCNMYLENEPPILVLDKGYLNL